MNRLHQEDPPAKINFGLQENTCNLSCPKCLVHSEDYPRGIQLRKSLGIMKIDDIVRVLDEIASFQPLVSPSYWGEPLLNKRLFKKFTTESVLRGIPVMINTNALLIDEDMADFLVDNLSVISISIDAVSPEVLEKTRSTRDLDQIKLAVHRLIEKRGPEKTPRIVVSFSEEEVNSHEKEHFISYWLDHVDAIRINEIYSDIRQLNKAEENPERVPCREIYDSMNIDYNGEVRMCCIDGYRETNLGNVFQSGVVNVWNGEKYKKLRRGHEGKEPLDQFCTDCDQWAGFNIIEEYEKDGLLIRKTAHSTYLNRLDRLSNWTDDVRRREV